MISQKNFREIEPTTCYDFNGLCIPEELEGKYSNRRELPNL